MGDAKRSSPQPSVTLLPFDWFKGSKKRLVAFRTDAYFLPLLLTCPFWGYIILLLG
jgi:hypothetical protein